MNKHFFILIAASFFAINISLKGQTPFDILITEDVSGYSLADFFLIVEHDLPVRFFYKDEWIKQVKIPNMGGERNVLKILDHTLKRYQFIHIDILKNNIIIVPQDYSYMLADDKVSFIKKVGNPVEKGKYSLNKVSGKVVFGKNGEPLPGAVVSDLKNKKHTTTDINGNYTLSLPGGLTTLQFSFMGLETAEVEAEIFSHGKLDVELMEAPIALGAVDVTANGGKNNVQRTQMGLIYMDIKNISKLPVLMGEADIIKSMTLLPGVSSVGEMSSGFNVRGGNVDQNLILINDAPVFNTNHLFGLFSAIIPGAVSAVNLYKGSQPANYGSAVSSVMDIKLKTPDTTQFKGNAGIGLLNSSVFVEGPSKNRKLSAFAGARTTYSNWLLATIPDIDISNSKTNFYDAIVKIDYRANRNNNFNAFAYLSHDFFKYSDINQYEYGTTIGAANYTHFFTDDLQFYSALSYSGYNNTVSYINDTATAYSVKTGINKINWRNEARYRFNNHEFVGGVEVMQYVIKPGQQNKFTQQSGANELTLDNETAYEAAVFLHDNFKINDKLSLMAGLRYSWYSKIGSATVNTYLPNMPLNVNTVNGKKQYADGEFIKPYSGFEPRVGLKYSITNSASVKFGYNVTRQYQHLTSNSSLSTPADYWKASDEFVKPLFSSIYSAGVFKNFLGDIVETSAEVYYKTTNNIIDYKQGALIYMNPAIEQDIVQGFSRSYGLELMTKKNAGFLTGWVSYTLSRSQVQVNGAFADETINNGSFYPAYSHRLHDLSVAANYKITRRWTLGANFIFSSGRPATYPEIKYSYNNVEVVNFSERNKYNLPANHRLDFSVTYEGFLNVTKKVHPSFTFSVYNVYGHKNIYSVYYKSSTPSSANNYQKYGLYQLSIIGVPIPSFTVNLTF